MSPQQALTAVRFAGKGRRVVIHVSLVVTPVIRGLVVHVMRIRKAANEAFLVYSAGFLDPELG